MPFSNDAQIQAAIQKVFKKASTDAAFRKLCLSNAAAAVKQATGEDVPPKFKLRFVENAGASLTIVLPDPPRAGGELKDEELEAVAGGSRCAASCGGSCAASCFMSGIY
ncbi:MAG TPA: NHLP leader peptide family RiPP precursor [Opitutaceae bacterium]|nr:NHLP leader peptide family RiPP precursor [Opitutaceae bacterium]